MFTSDPNFVTVALVLILMACMSGGIITILNWLVKKYLVKEVKNVN